MTFMLRRDKPVQKLLRYCKCTKTLPKITSLKKARRNLQSSTYNVKLYTILRSWLRTLLELSIGLLNKSTRTYRKKKNWTQWEEVVYKFKLKKVLYLLAVLGCQLLSFSMFARYIS